MVLHRTCATFGKDPADFHDFPFNFAVWSQFASDCLWEASFWQSKDHEEFKRVALNRSFPRTQVLTQSVQRQVQALMERKDAYNMQVLQDWKNIPLVTNYVSE